MIDSSGPAGWAPGASGVWRSAVSGANLQWGHRPLGGSLGFEFTDPLLHVALTLAASSCAHRPQNLGSSLSFFLSLFLGA